MYSTRIIRVRTYYMYVATCINAHVHGKFLRTHID